jgi:ADP-ribosyl-[dinitrogen reductase] hydrolase
VINLDDGGTWNLIAGQPTDDSEMALALARTLVRHDKFDEQAVAGAYVEWRKSGPFDIGATTESAITALSAGRPVPSESQSNGALMRVSPLGIFAAGDPKKAADLAARDARLTHPNPVCVAASAAYAAAIAAGIRGAGPEAMCAAAHDHAGDGTGSELVRERLVAARSNPPQNFEHQIGWVLTAFQNAFFWLLRGTDLADAVIETVGKGGDTDTNAAVCGALLGAAQGRGAVPLQWRNAVLTCRPVRSRDIRHPRPNTYWPDDALQLAEALVAAGKA